MAMMMARAMAMTRGETASKTTTEEVGQSNKSTQETREKKVGPQWPPEACKQEGGEWAAVAWPLGEARHRDFICRVRPIHGR